MEVEKSKLELALARNCYSLLDLKDKSKIGGSVISKLTKEKIILRPKTVGIIAKALNVDVDFLLKKEKMDWLTPTKLINQSIVRDCPL